MNCRSFASLALVSLAASASRIAPAWPADKPRKKVSIAVSTTVLNVSYPMLTLPLTLGYWRDEGYDVDLFPVGASLQTIQQLVGGNADFGEVTPA